MNYEFHKIGTKKYNYNLIYNLLNYISNTKNIIIDLAFI